MNLIGLPANDCRGLTVCEYVVSPIIAGSRHVLEHHTYFHFVSSGRIKRVIDTNESRW
jgi:hypothetical protein